LSADKKIFRWGLIALLLIVVVFPVVWILVVRLEGEKPSLTLKLTSSSIRASQEFSVSVSDTKSGLRRVWVGLLKDGREIVLLERDFPKESFIGGGETHEATFKIKIEPKKMGITDGRAILRMVARDYSWRRWWHGNRTYVEKDVTIDTMAPVIDVLSRVHNISQGGAGLVIYRVSEPCPESGVIAGNNFFPGHAGYYKDANILLAFFALNYNQGPGTEIFVKATDYAGNSARAGFPYYIKRKVFKKDAINISDRFINWKAPEFDIEIPLESKTPMADKFLKINRDFRQDNYRKIIGLVEESDNTLHWEGVFLRLPKSERMASFADHRDYRYKGRKIDQQVHLGIDLASLAQSPVPASNAGKIKFVGFIGIYGKTIIIDHGFGLLSMYSHLSSIGVTKDQIVSKGEIIGRTGSTGLAGGDHLHFSMLIHNTFVNPIEWWDADWIKNNISNKIDSAKARWGEG